MLKSLQKRIGPLAFFTIVNQILEEKMAYELIESPIELTDDQLDMVAAAGGSLVNVEVEDNKILNENNVAANVLGFQAGKQST
jgi:hypothetical protein